MKILIADDELNNRILMHHFLASWGQCDLVQDGAEAVEAFELAAADGQPYDLICLDLFMLHMNGDVALQRIRAMEEQLGIPPQFRTFVVIITSHEENDMEESLTASDACIATLLKPITRQKLEETLENNGFFLPDEVTQDPGQASPPTPPSPPPPLPAIPGLDLADGLDRVMGNATLFRELLNNFVSHHATDLQKFLDELEVGNQEAALRLLHTLKGAAGNISAFRLHQAAKSLETTLRNHAPPEERAAPMAEFAASMNAILTDLKNALQTAETVPHEGQDPP